MRRFRPSALGFAAAWFTLLLGGVSHAQAPSLTAPNVLLVVDTSGSFERMLDGTLPADNAATRCDPGRPSPPNRWGVAMQALTGEVLPYYSCIEMDRRSGSPFAKEYQLGGKPPYDADYYLPFHRPVSGTSVTDACAYGPNFVPGGQTGLIGVGVGDRKGPGAGDEFPADAIGTFRVEPITTGAPIDPGGFNATCEFHQVPNGLIDSASSLARFGLMMFDNDTNEGTGSRNNGIELLPALSPPLPGSPFGGMWSYWWRSTGNWLPPTSQGFYLGYPAYCDTDLPIELGARNPVAPPWEGRMMKFPAAGASQVELATHNERVKDVIRSMRPYGASPTAALLEDARAYFWFDPSGPLVSDPLTTDPNDGCRRPQYIVLLTDGSPNFDLRPFCEHSATPPGRDGRCPFQKAEDIIRHLADPSWVPPAGPGLAPVPTPPSGAQPIYTFVIGFAASDENGGFSGFPDGSKNCSQFWLAHSAGGTSAYAFENYCATNPPPFDSAASACCAIQRLASYGSPPPDTSGAQIQSAYFVDSAQGLNGALAAIMGRILRSQGARTLPAVSSIMATSTSTGTGAVGATYVSVFSPQTGTATEPQPWSGNIIRTRMTCDSTLGAVSDARPIDSPPLSERRREGDDFAFNMNDQTVANTRPGRTYITVVPNDSARLLSGASMRASSLPAGVPTGGSDGVESFFGGTYPTGDVIQGDEDRILEAFLARPLVGDRVPGLLIGPSSCAFIHATPALTPPECAKVAINFALGEGGASMLTGHTSPDPNAGGGASIPTPFYTRNPFLDAAGTNAPFGPSRLGAVLHSTPVVVPAPGSILLDPGYRAFAATYKDRPPMLYVATTDGLLHGFHATAGGYTNPPTVPEQNEVWAFMPPAVHPMLISNYPGGQQILLDGSPVVRDVVWERDKATAADPTVWAKPWHTMLVAGMGAGRGYFALDVTDPNIPLAQSAYTNTSGPQFLWQHAALPNAPVQLFGKYSATPAITTAFIEDTAGVAKEVGIAILPGGSDGTAYPPPHACPRKELPTGVTSWRFRSKVRKWTSDCNNGVSGRSVTVVRIDNGEILAVFGRVDSAAGRSDMPQQIGLAPANKGIDTPLDSPMTGTPVVYPNGPGQIAKFFYLSDADGTIWRFDISSLNPRDWVGYMYFDAFNQDVMTTTPVSTSAPTLPGTVLEDKLAWMSQPVSVTPVLSLDTNGKPVLLVATGEQDTFPTEVRAGNQVAAPIWNFVYSMTDEQVGVHPTATARYAGSAAAVPVPLLRGKPNWYLPMGPGSTPPGGLREGEHVTGPMTIFNRVAYFATFGPANTSVCGGASRLWAVDYLKPRGLCDATYERIGCGGDPAGSLCPENSAPHESFLTLGVDLCGGAPFGGAGSAGTLIPGVAIQGMPTCGRFDEVTDEYSGGTYRATQDIRPGGYQLITQVGNRTGSGFIQPRSLPLRLPPPPSLVTIDAWAAIVE